MRTNWRAGEKIDKAHSLNDIAVFSQSTAVSVSHKIGDVLFPLVFMSEYFIASLVIGLLVISKSATGFENIILFCD